MQDGNRFTPSWFFISLRRSGRVGFSFGSGGGGSTKVILTLDDLIFINTQVSKRVGYVSLYLVSLLKCDVELKKACC